MPSPLHQRDPQSAGKSIIGFVQIIYFDLKFNYIAGTVRQATIVSDAPDDWESETCRLIPHIWYEFTRVSKKNPETSRSDKTRIHEAREKVKLFASTSKNKGSILRIVKETIVTKLYPDVNAISDINLYYLEESFSSLTSDTIASQRKTREMPHHPKEMRKTPAKKNSFTSNKRRVK